MTIVRDLLLIRCTALLEKPGPGSAFFGLQFDGAPWIGLRPELSNPFPFVKQTTVSRSSAWVKVSSHGDHCRRVVMAAQLNYFHLFELPCKDRCHRVARTKSYSWHCFKWTSYFTSRRNMLNVSLMTLWVGIIISLISHFTGLLFISNY